MPKNNFIIDDFYDMIVQKKKNQGNFYETQYTAIKNI